MARVSCAVQKHRAQSETAVSAVSAVRAKAQSACGESERARWLVCYALGWGASSAPSYINCTNLCHANRTLSNSTHPKSTNSAQDGRTLRPTRAAGGKAARRALETRLVAAQASESARVLGCP